MEISEIQKTIEQLQYELNTENQRGGLRDNAKVANLEAQIAELTAELDKPAVDPVIAKANEEVELFGTTLEPFCKNTLSYHAVRSSVVNKVYSLIDIAKAAQEAAEKQAFHDRAENDELSKQIEERDVYISELKKELYEAKMQAEDNANKRDAACRELLEAKQTIDTLNDKLAAATTEVTAPKVRTNVDGPDTAAAELYKQSLPAIYDVTPLDFRQSKFRAKFADTDEEFEDYYLYKNAKYREVSAEQAVTFRTEYLDAQQPTVSDEDYSYDIPAHNDEVTYTVPAFRTEDSSTGGLDQGNAGLEMAGEEVTPEAFQRALERISALELAVFIKEEAA